MPGVRIDALPTTGNPSPGHELPAMREGQTHKLSVEQIAAIARLFNGSESTFPFSAESLAAAVIELGDAVMLRAVSTAVAEALDNRVRVDAPQAHSPVRQEQGRVNIGAAAADQNPLRGHLLGLTLSNNTSDADHDIDISAGEAASDGADPVLMRLASAITKRFDAAFAEGDGNGGMVTGESLPTSGTIHIWLIGKEDGTVDVCSNNHANSGLSPTLPSGFTHKRRIASWLTDGSANLRGIVQSADRFDLVASVLNLETVTVSMASPNLVDVSVPVGVRVTARLMTYLLSSSNTTILASPPFSSDTPSNTVNMTLRSTSSGQASNNEISVATETGQIRIQRAENNPTDRFVLRTLGWLDRRL